MADYVGVDVSKRTCVVPNGQEPCGKPVNGHGMCRTHYSRWKIHGDPQAHIPIKAKIPQGDRCSLGCDEPPLARGWCAMHYARWRTTGNVGDATRVWLPTDPDAPVKACTKCGETKSKSDFHKESRIRDGRKSHCKACEAAAGRNARFKRKYGITADDYDQMMADQGGNCWICKGPPGPRGLVMDHCHKGGHVRGLLCNNCNALLGMANDDVERLRTAIRYLEESQK